MASKTFKTRIDIPEISREKLIALTNQQLADTFDLYSQTKQAHWNVKGPQFIALHELFDDLAADLPGFVDLIAERTTVLGGYVMGTARMAAASSRLPEFPTNVTEGMKMVDALATAFAHVAQSTRDAIDTADEVGDIDTADVFTEISRALDKSLWFLEAHLQA